MPSSIIATACVFIAVCCAVDLRTRRIPNLISGSAMLLGLGLNLAYFGVAGLLASVTGLVVTMAVLFGPFALGGIGAGDVKMMGAVGALLGLQLTLMGLGIGAVVGGVIMIVHLARVGRLREKLAATGDMVYAATVTRSVLPLKVSAADQGAIALPYSVPLGLGIVAMLAIAGPLGF
jgi:Flp pilus assembly protein protease CpaA